MVNWFCVNGSPQLHLMVFRWLMCPPEKETVFRRCLTRTSVATPALFVVNNGLLQFGPVQIALVADLAILAD